MKNFYDVYPHYAQLTKKNIRKRISEYVPLYLWYLLRREISLLKINLTSSTVKKKLQSARNVKINIAPGANSFPGWINIDINKLPGIDYAYDCRKGLPFFDDSVEAIYCEHFFEHLEYSHEAQYFINECYRVLKNDGIVRIVVPDGRKFLKAYASDQLDEIRRLIKNDEWFSGKWNTPMELINLVFRQGYEHHYTYDYQTLHKMISFYGFSVEEKQFNESSISDFISDSKIHASHSLYIEAIKRAPLP